MSNQSDVNSGQANQQELVERVERLEAQIQDLVKRLIYLEKLSFGSRK